jgi:hypothetical protein
MCLVSDWRQIQARIRKARTSADPPGQLAALYERTRDAMVAFELAQIHDKTGDQPEAVRWYTAAAERFRRAQWKQKAEEALTRLGAPIPVALVPIPVTEPGAEQPPPRLEPNIVEFPEAQVPEAADQPDNTQQETLFGQSIDVSAQSPVTGAVPVQRRKRRGRRGGRGRHKGPRPAGPVLATLAPVSVMPSSSESVMQPRPAPIVRPFVSEQLSEVRPREPEPASSFDIAASNSSLQTRARAGDPALSSRMTKLESQLRRLLACSLHSVDLAEEAPAGPGVFLITDTDQTCYYYIEACQTLRVGIGNLLRSGRSGREGTNLKERLAEHLGITEARVGKYLKDSCVVRWLQLDEGAPLLAHFAIAVLRPVAND